MKTKNIILNIDKIRSMSLLVIFLLYNIAINAQTSKLSGIVSDAVGILPGVSVSVKGTTNGTITDADGMYSLIVDAHATLVFSFVGMKTQEVPVNGRNQINITLQDDTELLDEVVVVGYGSQKKKLVTGATSHVGGDDIAKLNSTTVLSALQSQTPGVNITSDTGEPGQGFKVNIRGMGTIGDATPLYVIDGVAGGNINTLNPADIESIDVLKDAASCAIYGARAANGVILVTTKQGESGKIRISYDGYIGWQNMQRFPDILNAKEYVDMVELITFNTGDRVLNWKEILGDRYESIMSGDDKGTNWLDAIRQKNAPINNHAINIAGGSERSRFSIGVSYSSQNGILGKPVESHYEHTTARLNSEHVLLKLGNRDIVKLGENLFYSYDH